MKLEILKQKRYLVVVGVVITLCIVWAVSNSSKTQSKEVSNSRDTRVKITDLKSVSEGSEQQVTNAPQIDSYVAQKASCVHHEVSGAVLSPGVYCLAPGSLLVDLVERAGGFDLSKYASRYIIQKLNLAQVIEPNKKYYIPYEWDMPSSTNYIVVPDAKLKADLPNGSDNPEPDTEPDGNGNCININSATAAELDSLDGVGPSTAEKIIAARPFTKIEDLLDVSGIGEATFNKFKDKICV